MIISTQFLKQIRSAFDLNEYETKIWAALLSKGIATAGELADISNVPRSRTYDVLESLEKKSFVIMKLGKPIKYIAVEPKEIIQRVKKESKRKLNLELKSLDNIEKTDVFNELTLLYKNGINHVDPSLISGAVKGRKNVYNQINTMLSNAKTSVIISNSATGIRKDADELQPALKKLKLKGIDIKILAPQTEENKDFIKDLKKLAKLKDAKTDSRFVIVDGTEIIFMLENDEKIHDSYDIGIWVNSPFFANSMKTLVESAW